MIVARAPLRISLGGGGTDLPSYSSRFGGFILSAAITKYVYVCIHKLVAEDIIRICSEWHEEVTYPGEIQHDLIRHALELVQVEKGIEIISMADVPFGTGLGSSGSYLVALLNALYTYNKDSRTKEHIAKESSFIEMELASRPVGKHDHYIATYGGLTSLDIATDGSVKVSTLQIEPSTLQDMSKNILLFYTGMRRNSISILQEQQDRTEKLDNFIVEGLHQTKELGKAIKDALEDGDLDRFGLLLDVHWQKKRQRSRSISNTQIDRWYEVAKSYGALGGKIVGAGGGGVLMVYCPHIACNTVRCALTAEGLRELDYEFDFQGTTVVLDQP